MMCKSQFLYDGWPGRIAVVLLVALLWSLGVVRPALAQEPTTPDLTTADPSTPDSTIPDSTIPNPTTAITPAMHDKVCIDGLVINHAEKPSAGWQVTATPRTVDTGDLAPENALVATADGGGKFAFADSLSVGDWQLTIEEKAGWEPITSASIAVPLVYGESECARVRFKMRQTIQVTVLKIDDDHETVANWKFKATPGVGNRFAEPVVRMTNDAGEAIFMLTPGHWTFTEESVGNQNYRAIVPEEGEQELEIVAPGPHSIRFKNRLTKYACIEVTKYDLPPQPLESAGLVGWEIQVKRVDDELVESGVTDAAGKVRFDQLPLGPYLVTAESRSGWKPKAPTTLRVMGKAGPCVAVDFYTEQDWKYCIAGRKVDKNGAVGLADWKITARPLKPEWYEPEPVMTNGLGKYEFVLPKDDYRIPGAEYEVCEAGTKPGWLADSAACYTVTVPTEPGQCVQAPDFVNKQVGHDGDTGATPGLVTPAVPLTQTVPTMPTLSTTPTLSITPIASATPAAPITPSVPANPLSPTPLATPILPATPKILGTPVAPGLPTPDECPAAQADTMSTGPATSGGPSACSGAGPDQENNAETDEPFDATPPMPGNSLASTSISPMGTSANNPSPALPISPTPTSATSPSATGQTCPKVHMVQESESVLTLVRRYRVPLNELMNANPWMQTQSGFTLQLGQEVCIVNTMLHD